MLFDSDTSYPLAPFVLVLTITAAAAPLLSGKYLFFLDSVAGPDWPSLAGFYGFSTPTYGGRLPITLALHALTEALGASVAQKVLFTATLALIAFVPYLTLPGSSAVRLYGALLFLLNPFSYVRLLAGHWIVLWGLAMLPLALYAIDRYLGDGDRKTLAFAVTALTLLGVSSHLLFVSGFLFAVLVATRYTTERQVRMLGRVMMLLLVAILVNAYWLGPVFLSPSGPLSTVGAAGISTFAPDADVFNALYSIASMHGFWRGGYRYPGEIVPGVEFLFVPVLFLSAYGFVVYRNDPKRGHIVRALGVTWVVALLLGAGVNGPAASAYRWLFEHTPLFAGLRDSQKLVALLVLVYAYLGSLGLAALRAELNRNGRTYARIALTLAIILTPIVYTFPMVTGYAGQINADDYPASWYEVRSQVRENSDAGASDDGYILFLPWHQYADYRWLEKEPNRIPTPAREFFERPVIQGDNLEIRSVYSHSSNPVSYYVQTLFGLGPGGDRSNATNLGALLARANVEYVVVTKEVDWRHYDAILQNQSDLRLALENEQFRVYRNRHETVRAYATDDVTRVSGLSAFVARNRRGDTTDSAYVFVTDDAVIRPPSSAASGKAITVRQLSPVRYRVEGTDSEYVVYRPPQTKSSDGCLYGMGDDGWRSLGFAPVFKADDQATQLVYAPFYRTYLPSYVLSLLAVSALLVEAFRPRK